MTQTVTITNAIPVEYSYMLPSGQWPASSARVKIDAKWIGQPMRTRAIPMSPRIRLRNARWSTKATTASVYAATAIPNRTRDAGVLDMPAGEYSHRGCRGGLRHRLRPSGVRPVKEWTRAIRFARRLLTMGAMSRPRVLLADDDPRVVSVVSRYLALEGYEMSIATDGEAAVRIAEADRPDLIILDIMMPGIDGIEACRRIRANAGTAQTPVLMFSALVGGSGGRSPRRRGRHAPQTLQPAGACRSGENLLRDPHRLVGASGARPILQNASPDLVSGR